jgi:6-phosphogluconolactonase
VDSVLTPEIRVLADPVAVAAALAEHMARTIRAAVRQTGSASVVLSGGRTPRLLYERLARAHAGDVPWRDVHVWWSDERYVPAEDADSNIRLARDTLIDRVSIPPSQIHPMPTTPEKPEVAAGLYEQALERSFQGRLPRFDLVLLGIGTDGHTASLFPRSEALSETKRMVVVTTAPTPPKTRLTLTYPLLNNASSVQFLVTGAEKAPVLQRVLEGKCAVVDCPAAGVQAVSGEMIWWLDEAAYGGHSG